MRNMIYEDLYRFKLQFYKLPTLILDEIPSLCNRSYLLLRFSFAITSSQFNLSVNLIDKKKTQQISSHIFE